MRQQDRNATTPPSTEPAAPPQSWARSLFLLLLGPLLAAQLWAAAGLAPPGRTAELVGERVAVRYDGQHATVIVQASVATDARRAALLYAIPAGDHDFATPNWGLPELQSLSTQVEWQRQLVPTTLAKLVRRMRAGAYVDAMPDRRVTAEARGRVVEIVQPEAIAKAGVEPWLDAQGYALTEPLKAWLNQQQQAGRSFVSIEFEPEAGDGWRAVALPAFSLSYATEDGFVPFSQPQETDPAQANAVQRPYVLAVLAPDRRRPVWPDGTAIMPGMAMQVAWTITPERWQGTFGTDPRQPQREATPYLTVYEANVPAPARAHDLLLQPDDQPQAPPKRVVKRLQPVLVPVDAIAAVVLLGLGAVVLVVRRASRRRAAAVT